MMEPIYPFISSSSLISVIEPIDYRKLQVDKTVLAKALCTFLAQVAKKHASHNKRDHASVAQSLDCNQRRSIIPSRSAERAPD